MLARSQFRLQRGIIQKPNSVPSPVSHAGPPAGAVESGSEGQRPGEVGRPEGGARRRGRCQAQGERMGGKGAAEGETTPPPPADPCTADKQRDGSKRDTQEALC